MTLRYPEALRAEALANPPPLLGEAEFAQLEPEPSGLWARIRSMFK